MTDPHIERDPVVEALTTEWAEIDSLLSGLEEAEWARPALPGWTVQDTVAHIIGTESMLAGDELPGTGIDAKALPYVRNDIGVANEHWVQSLRGESPAGVLARFRSVIARRQDALASCSQSDFDAPSWTPVGNGTYGRFMQIRVFDCWMHEQDIRYAVDRPGHEADSPAEFSLDEIVRALGYLVGKKAGAPEGSAVTISLTGPLQRDIHVLVEGRARVVDRLDRPATATVGMGSALFFRLAGGRDNQAAHLGEIDLGGDVELATRLAANLAFTI